LTNNNKLTELDCYFNNNLTHLDVSQNEQLRRLSCFGGQLSKLSFGKNEQLALLLCQDNKLISLNLSGCKELKNFSCHANSLSSNYLLSITSKIDSFFPNESVQKLLQSFLSEKEAWLMKRSKNKTHSLLLKRFQVTIKNYPSKLISL
jgi:hypothetical protein